MKTTPVILDVLLPIFAAVLGAIVGSFLNACIHRMPRGLSLSDPRRSFCPECKKTIPWRENLPLVSWILLRGRCSACGVGIPFRYFLVELVTAIFFMALWQFYSLPLAPAYWIFSSLLIAATFIDLEHFIIPDEITWGGAVAGVFLSFLFPAMMEESSRWMAGLWSIAGAALGFGLLFGVVEGGKLAFGKIKHHFAPPEQFEWQRVGDSASLRAGSETLDWMEVFSREKDTLTVELEGMAQIDGREVSQEKLVFHYNSVLVDGQSVPLETLEKISGSMRSLVIPREAMGFGDVKFIACIGAFLGWKAVIFTLFAASIIGSLAGLAGLFLAKDKAGTRIPFGPFLALGAAIWLFGGRFLADWYFAGLLGLRAFIDF